MEDRPILSNNEKIALQTAGDSVSRIMTLDGKTAEDVIRERNIEKHNELVDRYVEKLNEHGQRLEDYTNQIAENINRIEIMPINNYLLIKQFDENPFQRIQKQGGIITDLGGQKPFYKNTDSGEWEEEESFILVGVVQEVGPECKWIRPNDTVMYTKPSQVPVPFYKQGLVLVNETRIMVVINEGLQNRFNEIKNGK